jgi:hypothetical protein
MLCFRILYPSNTPAIQKCLFADNPFCDSAIWAARLLVRYADSNTTQNTFYLLVSTCGETDRFLFRSHHPCVYANNVLWLIICILGITKLFSLKQNTLTLSLKIRAFWDVTCVDWSIFTDDAGELNDRVFSVQTVKENSFQWSRISTMEVFVEFF